MKFLYQPTGIVIHHSATRDTATISLDAIRNYHVKEMNWDDIGYHFVLELVDQSFVIGTGRGLQYVGAHTVGRNDMIGICVVGNFDETTLPLKELDRLLNLVAGIMMMYPYLTFDDIHYHRETANKTCPGNNFPALEQIKAGVKLKTGFIKGERHG